MSRLLPVCLLASALVVFVGCGGGAAPDSDAVAENSAPDAAPGNEATMSPAAEGEMSGGAMDESMYGAGEAGAEAGAEMDPAMNYEADMVNYPGAANPGDAADPAMTEDMYAVPGEEAPGADAAVDPAMTEEMYAAAAGAEAGAGDPGADPAISPAMEGAYPGGTVPGGEEGAGYPGGALTEKAPEGFDGKAQLAFRQGREKDAMQYLYAHALTSDAGAESLLPTIRWVSGLREPKLAVRWGAGFIVTAPRNYTGDPKPVGSEQNIPTRGGNKAGGPAASSGYVGGGGEADYGAAGGGGGSKNSLLSKGAGELGEKLAAAYTTRVMNGDYGEVLKKAMEGGTGGNRNNPGAGAGYSTEMGAGAAGYEGAAPGGGGAAAAADAMTQVTQIMPGLSMLGIGTQKELIERARGDGIDAVVIIDVKLRVNTSNGLVTNESTLSLLDAETQKKLHMTKKFNNITIQMARADGKDDGVDEELDKLFEAIDANFKMTDLPAGLNAEIAAKRVASLAAEKHNNPLPILAEARMYHAKGMLDESTLHTAYEQLLGVDSGRLLATGEEEDKKKVLSQWLPES